MWLLSLARCSLAPCLPALVRVTCREWGSAGLSNRLSIALARDRHPPSGSPAAPCRLRRNWVGRSPPCRSSPSRACGPTAVGRWPPSWGPILARLPQQGRCPCTLPGCCLDRAAPQPATLLAPGSLANQKGLRACGSAPRRRSAPPPCGGYAGRSYTLFGRRARKGSEWHGDKL